MNSHFHLINSNVYNNFVVNFIPLKIWDAVKFAGTGTAPQAVPVLAKDFATKYYCGVNNMKKIISILILLLMLTSCSRKIDNEIATIQKEDEVITQDSQISENKEGQPEPADKEVADTPKEENAQKPEQQEQAEPETENKDNQQKPIDKEVADTQKEENTQKPEQQEQSEPETENKDNQQKTIDKEVADTPKEENTQKPEPENKEEKPEPANKEAVDTQNIENGEPSEPEQQEENAEAKTNPDSEEIVISGTVENPNVATYSDIDTLWQNADYVIVGSPTQSYDEATQFWLDDLKNQAEFSDISLAQSYSVRTFKVNKVYKGENDKLKEIQVCEHVLTKDGQTQVMEGSYPTEEGSKYILFLFRANTDKEQYFPLLYQGKYSLNDSENKAQKSISQEMYKQVKERFKDEIK